MKNFLIERLLKTVIGKKEPILWLTVLVLSALLVVDPRIIDLLVAALQEIGALPADGDQLNRP